MFNPQSEKEFRRQIVRPPSPSDSSQDWREDGGHGNVRGGERVVDIGYSSGWSQPRYVFPLRVRVQSGPVSGQMP